jgi:hypothetical protein
VRWGRLFSPISERDESLAMTSTEREFSRSSSILTKGEKNEEANNGYYGMSVAGTRARLTIACCPYRLNNVFPLFCSWLSFH